MTLMMAIRFLFWTILELFVLGFALNSLMEKVEEEGFHWFRTPFSALLIILGYLVVIFKIIEALSRKD